MTKQQKQVYETPTIETLELRFEGAILDGSNNVYGNPGFAGGTIEDGETYNF